MNAWDQDVAEEMHRLGYTLQEIASVCQVCIATARSKLEAGGKYTGPVAPPGPAFDTNRGRALIAMRDVMGLSFADMGALYGYSRQWAHQSYNRAKVLLADEQAKGTDADIERDLKLAQSEIKRLGAGVK